MTIFSESVGCEEPDALEAGAVCGAATAADRRCLAHLDTEGRAAYLATLGPGSDVDATGVAFSGELLAELLNALRDDHGDAQLGKTAFVRATFSGEARFGGVTFCGEARFDGARFSGDARFDEATFIGATFIGATFIGAEFARVVGFDGATFSGDTRFDAAQFSGEARFGGATFSGEAVFGRISGFDGARFSGGARFSRARFSRGARFDEATFSGDARFDRATFSGEARFDGATFSGDARFDGATFSGDARFDVARFSGEAQFSGEARFGGATFSGEAQFGGVVFSGEAVFGGVRFSEAAVFGEATFSGNAFLRGRAARLVLDGALVEAELDVDIAARVVSARGLRSRERVSLRLRAARVDLSDAVCAGPLTVQGLQQPVDGLDESGLAETETGGVPVVVKSLERVDAALLVLTDVDLTGCRFAGLHRADQVQLDGRCTFATDPRRRRQVLAEEQHWRAQERAGRSRRLGGWAPAGEGEEVVGPARLEVLYRQLRKAFEDGKNEPGAADFYYGEMEMRRAAARGGEGVLLWLYWLVSGYGLRAGRAIAALAVVVVVLALGMQYVGFPGKPVPYLDALLYSLRSTVAVEVKSAAVPDEVTRWGQVFQTLLRIAGPLFVGLAALAIRNRVKR